MRRVTVTVEDALLRRAKADVAAGRAESVSAWVADAMRAKVRAREELIADLEELERVDPTSDEAIATVAQSLGRSKAWVTTTLGLRRPRARRAG